MLVDGVVKDALLYIALVGWQRQEIETDIVPREGLAGADILYLWDIFDLVLECLNF